MMKRKFINPFLGEKELKGKLFHLRKKAYRKNFRCFATGCSAQAIQSHILQKNGILHHISERQHLMSSKIDFFTQKYGFERIGVKDVFTFKGFCDFHDTKVFTSIETRTFLLTDYNNQLLLSLRGLLNEIRKKEIIIEWYKSIINDEEVSYHMNSTMLTLNIQQHELALNDLRGFWEQFNLDLRTGGQNFRFVVREIQKIPVATSSTFSFNSSDEMLSKYGTTDYLKPLDTIFINILPHFRKTYLVIGTKNSCDIECQVYLERFRAMDEKCLLKEINNILFRNIESWVCSESFYKSNISQHMKYIEVFKEETAFDFGTDVEMNINIFE